MKRLVEESTRGMGREEWEAARRGSIGGSDAAAVVGLSPYASPYSLWAEKAGLVVPAGISESARLGRILEPEVAKRFCEKTGKKVYRKNAILRNPLYPWAHARVDRLVAGEDAGLELKTTSSLNARRFKGGAFPPRYYIQCVHDMAVTGRARWYLAVWILSDAFLIFNIPRDEEEIRALMRAEESFWRRVETRDPPPMSGSDADAEAIERIYPEGGGTEVALSGRGKMLARYARLGEQAKALERKREAIRQTIKRDMGPAERAVADGFRVTWASGARTGYDLVRFEADHPGMLLGYERTSRLRTFRVEKG